jgi:phosphatidate cytidylyltransferase
MKRVLTAVVLILVVLLAVLKAPFWLYGMLCGVVGILALREFLDLVEAHGIRPLRRLAFSITLLLLAVPIALLNGKDNPSNVILPIFVAGAAIVWVPIVFVAAMRTTDLRQALASAGSSALGIMYLVFPLNCLIALRIVPDSWFLLFFLFFCVWAGDIFAFYVGSRFGRHKLAPRISPNKTWEGAIASVTGSLVVSWAWLSFAPQLSRVFLRFHLTQSAFDSDQYSAASPLWPMMFLALAVNVAAQLGDLVESMLKRGAGVKDSGSLLPGHGGVLDRIDALLFAAPIVWYYAAYLAALSSY